MIVWSSASLDVPQVSFSAFFAPAFWAFVLHLQNLLVPEGAEMVAAAVFFIDTTNGSPLLLS